MSRAVWRVRVLHRVVLDAIVFAQALTLLAFPAFAYVLMRILNDGDIMQSYRNAWWENVLAGIGVFLLSWMMVNTFLMVLGKIIY